jgi:uncharacterized repeat protein (TIGR04138 family)
MEEETPSRSMEDVIREDGRYPPEAFAFLHEGLNRAAESVHGDKGGSGQRHVSGQQLCLSVRDLALERWGMLAMAVLKRWNIHGTIDFGNMVYLLVENKFMRKTPEDSLEDFRDVYRFEEAFGGAWKFELKE